VSIAAFLFNLIVYQPFGCLRLRLLGIHFNTSLWPPNLDYFTFPPSTLRRRIFAQDA